MNDYDNQSSEEYSPPQKKTRAKKDPSEKRRRKQFLLHPLITEWLETKQNQNRYVENLLFEQMEREKRMLGIE